MENNLNYPINEIFATLQGEATFTGTPSVFIRFQGCEVGCGWCDTKHTWKLDVANQVSFIQISQKTQDKNNWADTSLDELILQVINFYIMEIEQWNS